MWQQRSVPTPAAHEVLIKPIAAGICGTDIHAGPAISRFLYPRVLGHELCGEVVALGAAAQGFQRAARGADSVACQRCDACLSGKTNCCEQISVIGVHQDGGFASFSACRTLICWRLTMWRLKQRH